jgi:hypothetical protein
MTDSIFLQVEKIKKSEVTAQIGLRRANPEPIGSFQPTQLRPTMLLNVVELQGVLTSTAPQRPTAAPNAPLPNDHRKSSRSPAQAYVMAITHEM